MRNLSVLSMSNRKRLDKLSQHRLNSITRQSVDFVANPICEQRYTMIGHDLSPDQSDCLFM